MKRTYAQRNAAKFLRYHASRISESPNIIMYVSRIFIEHVSAKDGPSVNSRTVAINCDRIEKVDIFLHDGTGREISRGYIMHSRPKEEREKKTID